MEPISDLIKKYHKPYKPDNYKTLKKVTSIRGKSVYHVSTSVEICCHPMNLAECLSDRRSQLDLILGVSSQNMVVSTDELQEKCSFASHLRCQCTLWGMTICKYVLGDMLTKGAFYIVDKLVFTILHLTRLVNNSLLRTLSKPRVIVPSSTRSASIRRPKPSDTNTNGL